MDNNIVRQAFTSIVSTTAIDWAINIEPVYFASSGPYDRTEVELQKHSERSVFSDDTHAIQNDAVFFPKA